MRDRTIIVFDGVCVLCSAWVKFVLKHDRRQEFHFAAMQTDAGRALLLQNGIDPEDPITFLLIDSDAAFTDSDAALQILTHFGRLWRAVAFLGKCVPRFLRNAVYRYVARNRYRLFGRREACLVPSAEYAKRFLK